MLTLAMMLAAASASEDRSAEPLPANDASTWVTTEDYPAAALSQAITGVSRAQLSVDNRGAVSGCEIVQSSGSADLDAATCRILVMRARFTPARDARGRAIAGTYTKGVRWQIPGRPNLAGIAFGAFGAGGVILRLHVLPDQSLSECHVLNVYGGAMEERLQIQECAKAREKIPELVRQMAIPPQGVWIELRQQFTAYRDRPDWGAGSQAAGSDAAPPSVTGPSPLPPGHT